jgi:hypothetical protein
MPQDGCRRIWAQGNPGMAHEIEHPVEIIMLDHIGVDREDRILLLSNRTLFCLRRPFGFC